MSSGSVLRGAVEAAVGSRVTSMSVVHGGDVAAAFRVELADGRRVFAKTHPTAPPGFFTTESRGLTWLREAGAVNVPEVLAVADEPVPMLVLEWLDVGGGQSEAGEEPFGRALAALHDAGAPCFGRADRRTTGSRALPNEPRETWVAFYSTNRLLPLARLARDGGALSGTAIAGLERLAASLDRFDDGAPPRLHGDLWAGNRLVDATGQSWVIDPAAHGGHREFDLAMMRLFGGFDEACFTAYADVHPLADGWAERVELHQIAPLVVHAIKFGGGYVPAAERAIARYA